MVNRIEIFILLTFFIKMTKEIKASKILAFEIERMKRDIFHLKTKKSNLESTVLRIVLLFGRFRENAEKIKNIVNETSNEEDVYDPITNMVTCSGESKLTVSLFDYIEFLQSLINSYDEDLKELQEKLAELLPTRSIQEMSNKHKQSINRLHRSIIPQLMKILLERVAALRGNLTEPAQVPDLADSSSEATASSPSPSPSKKLFQTIFSMLEITDHDAIYRINEVFDKKSEEDILSNNGLVIILALSNIEGYSSREYFEYNRSIKGDSLSDNWMFKMLFESDSEYDLVSFPCLFFRAFEHPFIQYSLTFKNACDKDELKTNLRYINNFTRRFQDINPEVCLTFDDRRSHCNALAISPYLLHVGSLSMILELEDSE